MLNEEAMKTKPGIAFGFKTEFYFLIAAISVPLHSALFYGREMSRAHLIACKLVPLSEQEHLASEYRLEYLAEQLKVLLPQAFSKDWCTPNALLNFLVGLCSEDNGETGKAVIDAWNNRFADPHCPWAYDRTMHDAGKERAAEFSKNPEFVENIVHPITNLCLHMHIHLQFQYGLLGENNERLMKYDDLNNKTHQLMYLIGKCFRAHRMKDNKN